MNQSKTKDLIVAGFMAAVFAGIVFTQVHAAALAAATYAKKSDTILKTEGGASLHFIEFTITGGSGDTYLTSGVTPSATAMGFAGFKLLSCEPVTVAWTSYTTVARAIIMRSTNVQLANSTSINGTVFNCRGLAYE